MRAPFRLFLTGLLAAATWAMPSVGAQVRPVYDLGAAGLTQVLERLQTTASALHVGAHPDDEDSAFLARTARGDHARVAYLSLNRGEGGQNIIGPELFEALGVIRSEELLQARTLDGGQQFFTRAIDYGFSKTRQEAAAKWNEREILGDMVRVIRTFRPLVVSARFLGTPADDHGQHQLAGYLTPLAFRAAADPNEFPEQIAGRPAAVAGQAALSERPGRTHRRRNRRLRSGDRPQLRRDCRRGPQPAQVAADGRHRTPRQRTLDDAAGGGCQ